MPRVAAAAIFAADYDIRHDAFDAAELRYAYMLLNMFSPYQAAMPPLREKTLFAVADAGCCR